MTISKGTAWGAPVPRPVDLRVAADDAQLAEWLADGSGRPTAVASGDMWRTIGAATVDGRSELNALPIDLLAVEIDHQKAVAVSHVVARRGWWRGGWLRGAVIAVMNAEFVGNADVAPRGHPNDGRIEVLRVDARMSIRQRVAVRSRLARAAHLPHPQIATSSVKRVDFDELGGLVVFVDGRRHGPADRLSVRVRPDAAVLHG